MYFFIDFSKRRRRERERHLPVASCTRQGQGWTWQPFGVWDGIPTHRATGQGPAGTIFVPWRHEASLQAAHCEPREIPLEGEVCDTISAAPPTSLPRDPVLPPSPGTSVPGTRPGNELWAMLRKHTAQVTCRMDVSATRVETPRALVGHVRVRFWELGDSPRFCRNPGALTDSRENSSSRP